MKRNTNKMGFTLTEILIVIVLIGIVLAISVPSIAVIKEKINERLFEGKKEEILIAAELYGQDKGIIRDTIIYVHTLLKENYINADLESGEDGCSGDNTSYGCVTDPRDDSILNNTRILIKKNGRVTIAVWDGKEGSSTSEELVGTIKDQIGCSEVTQDKPCLFKGDNPNNYLYYSGVMWRILGVYNIDNKHVVKMVTDDNVVWEEKPI